jgi:3-oxoacyl-[acyl-carrier-protein] synthase-3
MVTAGIRALAATLPDDVRTNDYWRHRYPEIVAAEQRWQQKKARAKIQGPEVVEPGKLTDSLLFDATMAPYFGDPFHGAIERRLLRPGQSTTAMSTRAVREVLEVAHLPLSEVDLLISNSMFPDRVGSGDAAYIAKELEYEGGALNVDATCAGGLAAFLTGCAFVQSGQARNVIVVSSTHFSRAIEEKDPSALLTGDGASAFILSPVAAGGGLLGAKSIHTGNTCGGWFFDTAPDETETTVGGRKIRLGVTRTTMQAIRSSVGPYLRRCAEGALKAANVDLAEIQHFAFGTQTAWLADYSAKILGVPSERTLNIYPWYGNLGPASIMVGLHHAAALKKIRRGDLVLLYIFGGQAQASAAVFRWGDTQLGPLPPGVPNDLETFERKGLQQ